MSEELIEDVIMLVLEHDARDLCLKSCEKSSFVVFDGKVLVNSEEFPFLLEDQNCRFSSSPDPLVGRSCSKRLYFFVRGCLFQFSLYFPRLVSFFLFGEAVLSCVRV